MTPKELRELATGTILVDAEGLAHQVERPKDRDGNERWPGEVWLNHISDEYAYVTRAVAVGVDAIEAGIMPSGLKVVWTPPGGDGSCSRNTSTWYESYTPDGKVWCGSSDPDEVVRRSAGRECTYWKLVTKLETSFEVWTP